MRNDQELCIERRMFTSHSSAQTISIDKVLNKKSVTSNLSFKAVTLKENFIKWCAIYFKSHKMADNKRKQMADNKGKQMADNKGKQNGRQQKKRSSFNLVDLKESLTIEIKIDFVNIIGLCCNF